MNNFYVYVYFDTRKPGIYTYGDYEFEFEPFYIGKGSGYRLYEHIRLVDKDTDNLHKSNRIKKIKNVTGAYPLVQKIEENLDEDTALEKEKFLISIIGRFDLGCGPLLNCTDGGDGIKNISKKTREIFSERMKGEKNPNYKGKSISKEHISKQNRKGEKNPFYGLTHNEKNKKIISDVRKNESLKTKEKRKESLSLLRQQNPEKWCKKYKFINAQGIEIIVNSGIKKFAIDNDLPYGTILDMIKKKIIPKRGKLTGWKFMGD